MTNIKPNRVLVKCTHTVLWVFWGICWNRQ